MEGAKSSRTHKNVTIVGSPKRVVPPFKLLDPSGRVVEAFSIFAKMMAKGPINTYRTYCYHLADFMNYFYEAAIQVAVRRRRESLTRAELREIIDSWEEYLIYGAESQYEIARWVDEAIPSSRVEQSTSNNKHAALTKFLRLSEQIRIEQQGMAAMGLHHEAVDEDLLYTEMNRSIRLNGHERTAIIKSSMLAGAIAGQRTQRHAPIFELPRPESSHFDERRVFPLDLFHSFVNELTTNRDKALYSLYAASGCRSSEGLQLLWEDIDIERRDIRLVNPQRRANHPSYAALTYDERKQLVWKGRQSEATFLIEPFLSLFFEYLQKYVECEYYPHNEHQFVFQMLRRPSMGRPYFLSAPNSRHEIFARAAKKIDLPTWIDGPHTLRHAYGTYLLNYVPGENGQFGLPMGIVRFAMGHRDIKQTAKYAIYDRDLIKARLKFGNAQVFAGYEHRSVNQLKIDALKVQIEKLEAEDQFSDKKSAED